MLLVIVPAASVLTRLSRGMLFSALRATRISPTVALRHE
jgi:hypothetical protein